MVKTVQVNADNEHEFNSLTDHMTKLQIFNKCKIHEFSAFPLLLQLMFDQTLSNLIVCLKILQKLHTKVAQTN